MRKGICQYLFGIVLCLGVLSPAVRAQEDVNEPWDPAEHFRPFWESVELEAKLYNPVEKPDQDPNTQHRLAIQGAVAMIDYDQLIGVDQRMQNVVALDQDGVELYNTVGTGIGNRMYSSAEAVKRLVGFNQWADEFSFSVSIPMDPNRGYPTSLSRMEWSAGALVADVFETVDIPFEPNDTWIEPIPGLQILVEEASVEEGKYAYKIQAIYDRTVISFGSTGYWHFWNDETPPATMLIKMDLLDATGHPVLTQVTSGSFSSITSGHEIGDGLTETTVTGSGSCSGCGDATTIRYTFAIEPYELEARFVLEDIPVPSF